MAETTVYIIMSQILPIKITILTEGIQKGIYTYKDLLEKQSFNRQILDEDQSLIVI
jgi:hypothetical protein